MNEEKFDELFDKVMNNAISRPQRMWTSIVVIGLVQAIIYGGILAGIVWVTYHFISKYW